MKELPYKTLREVKEHLPEVLNRIFVYKEFAKMASDTLSVIQDLISFEIKTNVDFGYFTSQQNYTKEFCKYMNFNARAAYWQEQVNKLKGE